MSPPGLWCDAVLAAALIATDDGLGGVSLRACAGPARNHWLELWRAILPAHAPVRRIPVGINDDRLIGGLDLAATLAAGRPIAELGLIERCDGGAAVAAMAERMPAATAARLASAMDTSQVRVERDGVQRAVPARFALVALDEGVADDERPPASLTDRLAFHVDLTPLSHRDLDGSGFTAGQVAQARLAAPAMPMEPAMIEALCAAAQALGVASLRAAQLAARAARAHAALFGRAGVEEADIVAAARLVLGPRATILPSPELEPPPPGEAPPGETPNDAENADPAPDPLADLVIAAVAAAIPPDLLARLQAAAAGPRAGTAGKAGAPQNKGLRGRPAGLLRGLPRGGARLNLIETLRAAAPWQKLRLGDRPAPTRLAVRADDFRVTRFKQRRETATIFVVDASGSAALNRLAEAKGAAELLLADCYIRRDRVALIAFRGATAELILPPTRSLVRAKRALAGLPGGGGTPLALAIDAAAALADDCRRKGLSLALVFLTDGAANVSRAGKGGRPVAEADARAAARSLRAAGHAILFIDTAPRPQARAQAVAQDMGARYVALPYADARALSQVVRTAAQGAAA